MIPKTVKVGVLNYRIKPTAHLSVKAYRAVEEIAGTDSVPDNERVLEILGLTDPDAQVILVEAHAGPDTQAAVLVHEIIHACLAQAGMRDTLTFEAEESVTKRLAPLLLQVLRENPKLYEHLTSRRVGRRVGGAKSA